MVTSPKPCGFCGKTNHYAFQCWRKPAAFTGLAKKHATVQQKRWLAVRKHWMQSNPPDHAGYWYCQIRPCKLPSVPLTSDTLTLDHDIPKSKRPDLRFCQSNLKPAHGVCNSSKGSKYERQYQRYEAAKV